MTPLRLVAIAAIYLCAGIAWFILGSTVSVRSGEFDLRLSSDVAALWGGRHRQLAPTVWYERPKTVTETVQHKDAEGRVVARDVTRTVIEQVPVAIESSRIDVRLALDHRQKGLLWYDTYGVTVRAVYRALNPTDRTQSIVAQLAFPSDQVQFDNFVFRINGRPAARAEDPSTGATARVELLPGGEAVIELGYDSRGLDTWSYAFAPEGVAHVRDFTLTMRTDFERIDYPPGTMSPSAAGRAGDGWELEWRFDSLVTGRQIGMDLPNRINPGPMAARITYFAPVSLLFFLTVMVILGVLRSQNLHPMNYAFLSAAFFAFHLLLAYLVDHLSIHASFAIASAVSVFLVVSYLRIVAGPRFAVARAGVAQIVFLVLFSYAFFFEGYTGLTVTIGAVITLFVLMQATARVDWARAFSSAPAVEARQS
jgi:hypothetical protein